MQELPPEWPAVVDTHVHDVTVWPEFEHAVFKAKSSYENGDFLSAIRILRPLALHHPHQFVVRSLLGMALLEHGNGRSLKDALNHLRVAAGLEPSLLEAQHNYAAALIVNGRWKSARLQLEKVIELAGSKPASLDAVENPKSYVASIRVWIGRMFRNEGDLSSAILSAKSAIAEDSRVVDGHTLLGESYVDLADQQPERRRELLLLARDAYSNLVSMSTKKATLAHTNLGYVHEVLGETEKAIEEYSNALDLDPANVVSRGNLVGALTREGRWDEAREALLDGLELEPRNARYHALLGVAYMGLNNYDWAERSLVKALRLSPTYAVAQLALGILYTVWWRLDDAKRLLNMAWRSDKRQFVREWLDQARERVKDPDLNLCQRVYSRLPVDDRERLTELLDEKEERELNATEFDELAALAQRGEQLDVARLRAIADLASSEGVSLDEMMDKLGLRNHALA